MARDFSGGASVVQVASQSQADADFTMAVLANADTTGGGGAGHLFMLNDGTRRVQLRVLSATALWCVLNLGTNVAFDSGDVFALGEWAYWAFRFRTSDNYKDVVKNAASQANNSTSPGTTAISSTALLVGSGNTAGDTNTFDGRLGDFRWWDAFLSLDELALAMRGFPVRPDVCKVWWPTFGVQSPEPDWSGNNRHGTVTGTTRIDHPPGISAVSFWADKRFLVAPAVAAGGGRRMLTGVGR